MFAEYKIARLYLGMAHFTDLYPEVTEEQFRELGAMYDAWYSKTILG